MTLENTMASFLLRGWVENSLSILIHQHGLLSWLSEQNSSHLLKSKSPLPPQKSIFIILQDQDKSVAMLPLLSQQKNHGDRYLLSYYMIKGPIFLFISPFLTFCSSRSLLIPTFTSKPYNKPHCKKNYIGHASLISQTGFK